MDKEQAIDLLDNLIGMIEDNQENDYDTAFRMAIEALKQPKIVTCGECRHRDPEDKKCDCGHDIIWQLPRDDDWYCADAVRRTE